MEEAPKTVDPLQQTVATTIQGYMNRPEVERQDALGAIRFLSRPAQSVIVKEIRASYRRFQGDGDFAALLTAVLNLAARYASGGEAARKPTRRLEREDLHLICFDHLCS